MGAGGAFTQGFDFQKSPMPPAVAACGAPSAGRPLASGRRTRGSGRGDPAHCRLRAGRAPGTWAAVAGAAAASVRPGAWAPRSPLRAFAPCRRARGCSSHVLRNSLVGSAQSALLVQSQTGAPITLVHLDALSSARTREPPPPSGPAPTAPQVSLDLLPLYTDFPAADLRKGRMGSYVVLCDRLPSLGVMPPRSTCVPTSLRAWIHRVAFRPLMDIWVVCSFGLL